MKFDFTTIWDRAGKDAIAVDGFGREGFGPGPEAKAKNEEAKKQGGGFDLLPMWVADMNFATCPAITEELKARTDHPLYGYYAAPDLYYERIIRWHRERNGVTGLEKKHIAYENGVLGGVVTALNVLLSKGDKVLLHSPTYVGFTGCIKNNGWEIVHSPLVRDEEGIWRMDYEDMEKKIVDEKIHVCVFCSPHNPCGRVWERDELVRMMEIFERHEVWVVSDEIWSDILLNGRKHIPTQSVSEYARTHVIAEYAPTKTFNLAGLQGSYHICYNEWLSDRLEKEASLSHYNAMNVFSMHALLGAYSETGMAWVDELKKVLSENVNYACSFIRKHFPGVEFADAEGTYMLYLDCTKWCEKKGITIDELLQKGWDVYVAWQDGRGFHGPNSIRLNLALPTERVKEAFRRLQAYVFC